MDFSMIWISLVVLFHDIYGVKSLFMNIKILKLITLFIYALIFDRIVHKYSLLQKLGYVLNFMFQVFCVNSRNYRLVHNSPLPPSSTQLPNYPRESKNYLYAKCIIIVKVWDWYRTHVVLSTIKNMNKTWNFFKYIFSI